MITFVVVGNQWEREVEVDESDFEKYGDMAMEAMTRATEDILNNEDEAQWGFILMAYEKGYKDDPNKIVACLCEVVFRNAGYHTLADHARKQAQRMIDDSTN
jgi:translation elongation factor EF-G